MRRARVRYPSEGWLQPGALIYVTRMMLSLPPVITDPLFYFLAIPAVVLLGLSKGASPASA